MQVIEPLPPRQNESETADYVPQFDATDRYRLVAQGAFQYAGQLASVVAGIVLVPLMLSRLGTEAYGFWLLALAAPGFVVGIDNALYFSIARECAAQRDTIDESTREFLSACCGAHIGFGVLGAIAIAIIGGMITRNLQLTAAVRSTASIVFAAVAVSFIAGRVVSFANAVMCGLQRFGTINSITIGASALRLFGFVLLLLRHYSLSAIATWYMVVALAEALVAIGFPYRVRAVRADRSLWQWRRLRRAGKFGASSFLTTVIQNVWWFSPPVLLSMLSGGTSATASLYAGQRPCFIVSELNWRGAEVLFSASAGQEARSRHGASSELLVFGTRCLLAVAMPLSVGLFMLAPALVSIWLQAPPPQTVAVMRLTSIGVIADALWVGPLHILWGRGRARRVFFITAAVTASGLLLNLLLIPQVGPAGAALAFAVSAWLGATITMIEAARETGSSWLKVLLASLSAVAVPSTVLAVFTLTAAVLLRGHPRWFLLIAIAGGGILYSILFLVQQRAQRDSSGGHRWYWLSRHFRQFWRAQRR